MIQEPRLGFCEPQPTKRAMIRKCFAKRPRFHIHFTPTYGSWINLVERWFAELTNNRIQEAVFRSVKELQSAIREYINVHNEDPKPFVWDQDCGLNPRQHRSLRTAYGRYPILLIYVTNHWDRRLSNTSHISRPESLTLKGGDSHRLNSRCPGDRVTLRQRPLKKTARSVRQVHPTPPLW